MCMEDVRLGRASVTTTRAVDVPISSTAKVAEQRADRIAIRFRWGCNVSSHLFPWSGATTPPLFTLGSAGGFSEVYDIQRHGDMVTQPWYVSIGAGQCTVYVTEVFLGQM